MKEIDEKYRKKIYWNILKAVIIIAYFFIFNYAYSSSNNNNLKTLINILTMVFLIISIYLFEKAYKKDKFTIALEGIEVFILSVYSLTTEYITKKFNFEFKIYSLVTSITYTIYFIFKSGIIYTKARKEVAQNFSDIKQIVKKDEPIKKEAKKKSEKEHEKELNKNEQKIEKVTDNPIIIKKLTMKSIENRKKSESTKSKKKTPKHFQEKQSIIKMISSSFKKNKKRSKKND